MGLLKFVLLAIISISLYFIVTSIQNHMQAQKNFEQAQKDVNLAMRQLEDEAEEAQREVEHWRSEMQKEKAFMRHMVAHLRIIHYGLVQTERLTIRYKNIYPQNRIINCYNLLC